MSPEIPFELVLMEVGDHPVLFVYGEVDVLTAPLLHEALSTMMADGETSVFVDLANVTFIDSTGLTALVVAHRHLDEAGGELRLVSVPPTIANLFALVGLDERFGIDAAVTRSVE